VRNVATLSALDVGNETLTEINFIPWTGVLSLMVHARL
jgi:hypothetical protein